MPPTATSPTASRSTSSGNFWITAVAVGRRRRLRQDGKHVDFLETGGTILNCVFGKGGKLFCCDMGPFDTTGVGDDRPADQGRCRRRGHAALPRRHRLGGTSCRSPRSKPSRSAIPSRTTSTRSGISAWQDHRRRRPGRLGRVDHAVPRGQLRRQGDHRGHGAEPRSARTRSTPRRSGGRTSSRPGGTAITAASPPTPSRRSTSRSGT